MQKIDGPVGILQGEEILFSDFADGGAMWTGQGPRERRCSIRFAKPFLAPPAVLLGLSMWDVDHRTNNRIDLKAEGISASGFDILFSTWGDSRIARLRASWTAIGPLPDEEHWQLD